MTSATAPAQQDSNLQPAAERRRRLQATLDRAHLIDRIGRWAISISGILVIIGVMTILVFLLAESLPLFFSDKHPSATQAKMFLPQRYQGYTSAAYVWQTEASAGGEEKFGIPLLIWGTLKGAFWAMLFSTPISLLAAIFVSEFAGARARTVVKSAIEVLAGVPTVVVGFFAFVTLSTWMNDYYVNNTAYFSNGLWLLFGLQIVVAAVVSSGLGAAVVTRRISTGTKALLGFLALILAVMAAWVLGAMLEIILGTALKPLFGIAQYKQLNGMLAGLCLGFAIIPMVFSVAEDSMRAVPNSYREASLALGASRWETAILVVTPIAAPGIYASFMLGLARAVGETMIVLMASGNTPIFDLSPFTGMRTMSAAIAIEAPEKALGSTGFHVLFYVGALLFILTFALNAVTGLVIERLKSRHTSKAAA